MNNNNLQMGGGKLPSINLLANESEVEFNFIEIVLSWLGYKAENIRHKRSLNEYNCGDGTRKLRYKPDYVVTDDNGSPLLVIDAKSPHEKLENHIQQCASYCLHLNGINETVKYFVLSNGIRTVVYDWKGKKEIQELSYYDFEEKTDKYDGFFQLLSFRSLIKSDAIAKTDPDFVNAPPKLSFAVRKVKKWLYGKGLLCQEESFCKERTVFG